MKYRLLLLAIIALCGAFAVSFVGAQGTIIIVPTSTPAALRDSDKDGVPDRDDQCPNEPGPVDNRGCPVKVIATQPPVIIVPPQPTTGGVDSFAPPASASPTPTVPQQPAFVPPALPMDGCYVTPLTNNTVNVRTDPDMAAYIIGWLNPGQVYPALGYVMKGTEIWFVLDQYESAAGLVGFGSRTALTASACPQLSMELDAPTSDLVAPVSTINPGGPQSLECGTNSAGETDACWCDSNDAKCIVELVAECQGEGDYIETGPDTTACWKGDASDDGDTDNASRPSLNERLDAFKLDEGDDDPGVMPLACAAGNNGQLQVCWCPSNDGECLTWLVAICQGEGDYIETGPDTTACWVGGLNDSNSQQSLDDRIDSLKLVEGGDGPGVMPLACAAGNNGLLQVCWCPSNDGECLTWLVAICQGDGDYIETGPDTTACWVGGLNEDDGTSNSSSLPNSDIFSPLVSFPTNPTQ